MHFLNSLKNILKLSPSIINGLVSKFLRSNPFLNEFTGIFIERKLKWKGKPIILRDWAGYRYWQYPKDNVRLNWKRKAVSDANNIVQYIKHNIKQGWICFDIGANIGAISIPLWSKVGYHGKVISVEADPANIDKIKANLKLNNCPQDYVFNVALADKKGILPLRCFPGCNGWQTLGNPIFAKEYKSHVIEVPAISFEDLMETYKVDTVDFVKIDVEGAEVLVLRGMRALLTQKKIACVVFEVNYLMLEGTNSNVSQLMSIWDDFDYELWRLDQNGTPVPLDGSWPNNFVGDCIAFPNT